MEDVEKSREGQFLVRAALREVQEEIGWIPNPEDDLAQPFLGAAFNLRRGRDLNFYCHCHTLKTLRSVSALLLIRLVQSRKWQTRDRWEVAHLIPIPIDVIGADGRLLDPGLDALVGSGRHVRGLLYCLAHSEKFVMLKNSGR